MNARVKGGPRSQAVAGELSFIILAHDVGVAFPALPDEHVAEHARPDAFGLEARDLLRVDLVGAGSNHRAPELRERGDDLVIGEVVYPRGERLGAHIDGVRHAHEGSLLERDFFVVDIDEALILCGPEARDEGAALVIDAPEQPAREMDHQRVALEAARPRVGPPPPALDHVLLEAERLHLERLLELPCDDAPVDAGALHEGRIVAGARLR